MASCGLSGFEPHETMPFGDQRVPAFSPSNRIVTSIETSSQAVAPSIMSFIINGREVSHVFNQYRIQYPLQSYHHASPSKPRNLPAEVLDCIPSLRSTMAASMPRSRIPTPWRDKYRFRLHGVTFKEAHGTDTVTLHWGL